MELKKYQKRVIADLMDYLDQLNEQSSLGRAFSAYWESRQIPVGQDGIQGYQNIIDGVPHVCYKVPTGGGKTYLACASVKPIFAALPPVRRQVVVWLVPSDAILTQTLETLKNPSHPYRQRLNADFGSRVEVYSKEELLAGQNFSPATVAEQLSVMVLSYDSFRSANKEGRKAYQANGNLAPFATALGAPEQPIENADETALFQVINQLNPVVIVDESHHATSNLSTEMLVNFNPAFILDLTATPKKQANIISYVDALALKNENMVKLPVIAYNRTSQAEVITDAIDLRQSLEAAARQQQEMGGRYIRPIVLFQAQPKTGEDATSFERLREKLVAVGIPEPQIAIKTANIDELKGVDLLSSECEIRFIITVNALKEGWDCPFAYILASLANKTSQVEVEQILGRVLRQPHAARQRNQLLNMSYVLTSSNDFKSTLDQIVAGLNSAGFSKRDFRAVDEAQLDITNPPGPPSAATTTSDTGDSGDEEPAEFLDFDETEVATGLEERGTTATELTSSTSGSTGLAGMLDQAQQKGSDYEKEAEKAAELGGGFVPADLEGAVNTAQMFEEFREEVAGLKLPQFFIQTPPSALFSTGAEGVDLLHNDALAVSFTLQDKDTGLDLSTADEQMYRIDVRKKSDVPRAFRMTAADQRFMREHFSKLSVETQKHNAAGAIYERLKPINSVGDLDLRSYIERVTGNFGAEELLTYQEHPGAVAEKIRVKIRGLLEEHKFKKFYQDIETRHIGVGPSFTFPSVIQPVQSSSLIGGSLYEAEDRMNNDEMEFAGRFSGLDNVRWWHRNIDRKGFCINGPINHYPDFIVMTTRGTIVIVEPKGTQLKNDDSRRKVRLGTKWASMAGEKFRYYMVFQDGVTPLEGAYTSSQFFRILEQL
ncbi:DEAD/DEAH box helicase [Corynebacterium lujinxingii]|uniref:DEAD/DEAH box helicase family protein n=1 Tax=Corynebacterium lujinxingii TaxID=2763010 RepID=A0A7H0JZL3_9CORY|nr:DEAD/DEAH box helicase family protein [Corynebacterium lujinxingii]MBC3179655.1 DEAD/DEAH box helicase family protein [Corynebacterium lujinxingii]NNO10347.1 restriction endonuclease [Corynebacterium lujinxingii]QNP90479.1 DEAD/DEAH box helicase family protein [Corynebacterium lujinxingii]